MTSWVAEVCRDIAPAALQWLWPRYLPRAKLTILDGDPEMGKSLLTIALIARMSHGGVMPDGTELSRESTCVLCSAEDDAADTIRPRAEAAGVDLSRLVLPNLGGRVPRFPDDIPALEAIVREHAAELVVIDPLMAFLPPSVAANLDQCVRLALTPLTDMASRTGCAVLLVRHLTKRGHRRAVQHGQGSMGIVAAARAALYVAPHPRDPRVNVLAVAKSNVAVRPPTLGYRVVDSGAGQPVIEWTGPIDLTADDACRGGPAPMMPRERACGWLKRELAAGPRRAAEIYSAAGEAGIPDRTLNRAKSDLGVRSVRIYHKREDRSEWYWYDPDAPWPINAPFPRPFELPPLDPL